MIIFNFNHIKNGIIRVKLYALLSVFLFCACTHNDGNNFSISGTIVGLGNKKVFLLRQDWINNKFDTIDVKKSQNGKFTFKGKTTEPALCDIVVENGVHISVFVENADITLKAFYDDKLSENVIVEGSKSDKQFRDVINRVNKFAPEARGIINKLSESPNDSLADSLSMRIAEVNKKISNEVKSFVFENPDSYVAPVATLTMMDSRDLSASIENYQSCYEIMNKPVRESNAGQALKNFLEAFSNTYIGKKARDITGKTPQGQEISLSRIKGNAILVDFWASWCAPCREANPELVSLHNKYGGKGFKILSISLDDNKSRWIKAIEADKLAWDNISDLKGWSSPVAMLYNIKFIPQSFLLDSNYVIVAKNLMGRDLEEKIKELISEKR